MELDENEIVKSVIELMNRNPKFAKRILGLDKENPPLKKTRMRYERVKDHDYSTTPWVDY